MNIVRFNCLGKETQRKFNNSPLFKNTTPRMDAAPKSQKMEWILQAFNQNMYMTLSDWSRYLWISRWCNRRSLSQMDAARCILSLLKKSQLILGQGNYTKKIICICAINSSTYLILDTSLYTSGRRWVIGTVKNNQLPLALHLGIVIC